MLICGLAGGLLSTARADEPNTPLVVAVAVPAQPSAPATAKVWLPAVKVGGINRGEVMVISDTKTVLKPAEFARVPLTKPSPLASACNLPF